MKVLILSITAGYGHTQCANVLKDYLESKNTECKIIDVFTYISPLLGNSFNKSYLFSTKHIPKTYGQFYKHIDRTDTKQFFSRFAASAIAKVMENHIAEFAPDAIICTHVCASMMVDHLSSVNAPTIGIVTDFTIHPYWDDTCSDYYVLANDLLTLRAKKKFIPQEKILPFGIPINTKFKNKMSKEDARKKLGLDNKKTVLIMSGSMGFGDVIKPIIQMDKLPYDFQFVTICGRNKKMKKRIDKLELNKRIYNFGYSNEVDIFMDAADFLVTKPGGLTVSEALAKKIPLILANPIPGQEVMNAEFLVNNGAAMMVTKRFPADECLYELLTHEKRVKLMEEAMEYLSAPDAAERLGDFVIDLIKNNNNQ